jgi:ParB/RepB/Spo0J family partition protein
MKKIRDLELALIDPPDHAVRLWKDEAKMLETMESMQAVGLLQPIKVRPRGDRFEVVFGDRRSECARRLEWKTIPAIIEELSDFECIVQRYQENHGRDDVNPMEDAVYLAKLIEAGNLDEDGICKLVKKSPEYVARRLRILRMDSQLQDSLAEGKIGLGVAETLSQITDDDMRRMYLYHAIESEVSVKTAKLWLSQWKQSQVPSVQVQPISEQTPGTPLGAPPQLACEICGPCLDTYNLRSIMVHNWEVALLHKAIGQAKQKLAGEAE